MLENRLPGELNHPRTIDPRRVAIDRIWVLDISKKYEAIQRISGAK
jgi:hypothetical protein